MRAIITSLGTYGHVYPCLALGQALTRRGHDVIFHSSGNFRAEAERAGMTFVELMSAEDYRRAVTDPLVRSEKKGLQGSWAHIAPLLARGYKQLAPLVRQGETAVVGSTLALWARCLAEKFALPSATLHPAPYCLFSAEAPPPNLLPFLQTLPPLVLRAGFCAFERFVLDPVLVPDINRVRAEIGLPPVRNIVSAWMHAPNRVFCAAPEWFAPKQKDWPPQARSVGFVRLGAGGATLAPELDAFLRAGAPPVAITPSSGMASGEEFLVRALAACRALGQRAVVITGFPQQLPRLLPESVQVIPFAPYDLLAPRVAAFIHAGGIGTIAHALAAGLPQLLVPLTQDQYDNAARAERLGVARQLKVESSGRTWSETLHTQLHDPAMQHTRAAFAARMASEAVAEEVMADEVEAMLI